MDTFWGLSQTAWTAATALVTAGLLAVAIVAALYAARQVKIAYEQAVESRKAAFEASRPYVIVTAEPSAVSQHLFDLVVRNIGQRPALAVSIKLEPAPIRADEPQGHELSKVKMLNEPVAMLAPNQELRTFYDSHRDRDGRNDLPTSHRVSLRYQDSSGHQYEEVTVVDLEAAKGTMFAEVKTLHDIGKSLAEIQKLLKVSSVLARRGSVEVAAVVETRAERQDRLAQEAAESRRCHDQLVARLLPAARTDGVSERVSNVDAQGSSD